MRAKRTRTRSASRLITAVIVAGIVLLDVAAGPRITTYILQNYNDAGFLPGSEGYASLVTMSTCAALMLPLIQITLAVGFLIILDSAKKRNHDKEVVRAESALAKIESEERARKDREVEKEILENVFHAPGFESLSDYYADKDANEFKNEFKVVSA